MNCAVSYSFAIDDLTRKQHFGKCFPLSSCPVDWVYIMQVIGHVPASLHINIGTRSRLFSTFISVSPRPIECIGSGMPVSPCSMSYLNESLKGSAFHKIHEALDDLLSPLKNAPVCAP
jgi:hypothetical protein